MASSSVVKLNVGGTRFWTARETLLWIRDTFFTKLLGDKFSHVVDEEGAIFIDRDPVCFRVILNYLRTKRINLEENPGVSLSTLRDDAEFYGIQALVERIDAYQSLSDCGCGGILYYGILNPIKDSNLKMENTKVTGITGDHNWIAISYENTVACYRFQESVGWTLRFQSEMLKTEIEYLPLNNKYGEAGDKMVAASSGTIIRLWVCSDPTKSLIGSFDVGRNVDSLFFIGSSLVATCQSGRVAVWNSVTKNWQVQDTKPISCYDVAGSLLFLGCNQGTIFYVDMEKFPLRLKDDSLLINEFYNDPKGEQITAMSVYMTSMPPASADSCIEIAYGTPLGNLRVIIQHAQTLGHGPQLFQTFSVHSAGIQRVMLSEKYLVSVCQNDNHVRSWKITRFRGRMSTQPGSIPVASFKVGSSEHLGPNTGPFGDRDQPQIFVQSIAYEKKKLHALDSATGKKICTVSSTDNSEITSFCVNESDFASRVGSRSRRFLITGHENGTIQIWDLTTAFEMYFETSTQKKSLGRRNSVSLANDSEHQVADFF